MNNKKFEYGILSECGLVRKINQDRILIKIGEKGLLEFGMFVIADGMGGHDYGEIASTIAITELANWWDNTLISIIHSRDNIWPLIKSSLLAEFKNINYIITECKYNNVKMGTTLTVLFVYGDKYIIVHVGDSRIYVRDNNRLNQLTKDHTVIASELRNGLNKDLTINTSKSKLTQCIGIINNIYPYCKVSIIPRNNIFLVCSDGLYNYIANEELERIINAVNKHTQLQDIVNIIYREVINNGAGDNVSIILVRYK